MRELHLTHEQVKSLTEQAREAIPNEVCGLLFGNGTTVTSVVAIPNSASDPLHHFALEPMAHLNALKEADAQQLTLLAVYHSHPKSNAIASQEDIKDSRRAFPIMTHLVISLAQRRPQLAAWHITPDEVTSVELVLVGVLRKPNRDFVLSQTQLATIIIAGLLAVVVFVVIAVTLLPPAPPITTR